jgi:hypothetical protein
MEGFMRFAAVVALVLISGSMALAQKIKDTVPPVRSAPGSSRQTTVAPPPVTSSSASSAAQLSRIEQQTASLQSNKPATHPLSSSVKTTPALDLGKNKPVRASRSSQRTNRNGH